MSYTSEFREDPPVFLAKYVVIADSASVTGPVTTTPRKFYLKYEQKNVCTLRFAGPVAKDYILAYWLPWKMSDQTSIELDTAADFFFTSEMSNCRFSMLTEGAKPRVAHVAGNVTQTKRDSLEKTAFGDVKKVRRLSISGGRDHGYRGSDNADDSLKSSAFVFGRRKEDEGWKFYAQVAKGFADGTMLARPLESDIAIINACLQL